MIKHEHLKTLIEDIYHHDNRLDEDLTVKLINELRYSNLIIPAKREKDTLNFVIYEIDDLKYTALFTDIDEFKKFYKSHDIEGLDNSFQLYQNIVRTSDIEGYILNPSSHNYILEKELILSIKAPELETYLPDDAYDGEKLCEIYDNLDNRELEDFIDESSNIGNYMGLFEKFSSSQLLTLMLSTRDLSPFAQKSFISMDKSGPLAFMHVDKVGGEYATIFSSKNKLFNVNVDFKLFKYAQLINLSTLVNYVLCEDMDGIILNPDSDNILIPRSEILRNSNGFEKFCNDSRLSNAIFYLFLKKS